MWITLCVGFVSFMVNAQTKVYDEKGNWSGQYNMNPDPYGEPWIAGTLKPMTPEEQAKYDALSYFTMPEDLRGRQLPKTVDHSVEAAFRTIFNQSGGSCG